MSLAQDVAGLGTAWGEQTARTLLTEAGFEKITVTPTPTDPTNALFTATTRT